MNFSELEILLDSAHKRWNVPACECIVYKNHEKVFHHSAGYRNFLRTKPTGPDDLYWIYSFTKIFTMTLTLRLIEKGLIRLEDPVEKYLPSWSRLYVRQEDNILPCGIKPTVFHLMTMTAGLNYDLKAPAIQSLVKRHGKAVSLRMLSDALADEPLDFEPGEHFQYSLCHDLLGAVLEVASDTSLQELLDQYIVAPLGLRDTTFFPTKKHYQRLTQSFLFQDKLNRILPIGKKNPFVFSPNYASGGAGLISSASDLALLCDALANLGTGADGNRILSEDSVRLMARNHLTAEQMKDFNKMKPYPYGYGLGVRTLTEPCWGAPEGEFGWDGAAGAYNLIDINRNVSLVYTQQVLKHSCSFGEIHPLLRDTLYKALTID